MKYYLDALKQYFNFKGRCSRKAFWMFVLFNVIFLWLAILLDNIFGTTNGERYIFSYISYGAFHNFYSAFIGIPSLAIAIRRLHDTGKDWPMLFIVFIPIIGQIWMLLIMLTPGDAHENEFGPAPEDGFAGANPYKTSESKDRDEDIDLNVELQKIKQSVNESRAKEFKPKKEKKPRKSLMDRGAVDFTYHQKEKRKT